MEKNTKRGPLLYVSQTFLNTPMKNMQEVFTTRQEVQLPMEEPQLEEESTKKKFYEVSLAKTDLATGSGSKVKEAKEEIKSQTNQEKQRTFNRVKSFKEMDLMDRLEYLANLPKALPPVPCVFYTDEKNYQGFLVGFNEQDMTIRIPNQSTETIPLKNLKDIIMIGIKK
ncbi:CotO family spore coat protein [Neobacillus niacini]|uniref:CotO family spore coat protein n=1 Tax=Neobacillus niacini TaxID=86668 RepID=UPI003000883C